MISAFRQVIKNEGVGALATGFGPTFAGYFMQGAFKFGGYEFFQKKINDTVGPQKAHDNRTAIYMLSAGSAEFFASIALCPLEATRIRLVSTPGFANGLIGGFGKILKHEGIGAFYSGFGPILFKQYDILTIAPTTVRGISTRRTSSRSNITRYPALGTPIPSDAEGLSKVRVDS